MDKRKKPLAQKAPAFTSRARVTAKSTQKRNGYSPAKVYKPVKKTTGRPSKSGGNFIEDEELEERQPAAEESHEASAAAVPNAGGSALGGFGGIDGIISMMGKANQMIKLFQQMGPIFKLFGMFGGGAKVSTASVRLKARNAARHKVYTKSVPASNLSRRAAKSKSRIKR